MAASDGRCVRRGRSVESIGEFNYWAYTPDWRRSIDIGRLVFAAAFELSQGRAIDYAMLEQNLLKYRDQNFVHLAPLLKEWSEIVAARRDSAAQRRARLPAVSTLGSVFFAGSVQIVVLAGKAQISLTTQRGHSGLRALQI